MPPSRATNTKYYELRVLPAQLSTSLYLTYMQHHVRRVAQELSRQADGRSHRIVACMNKTTGIITQRKYVRCKLLRYCTPYGAESINAVQVGTVLYAQGLACSASAAAPQSLF
ncbi:hypothetical protein TsFJ059_007155 [Trichoderma semiorbis]|uniref:Uncharacterized protein n=1 Tax=Trichoderma semiorbis TaxID=1491008 RepID=A0A9P8KSC3_9HYPO|nr:hypothetical protein TsFJ059_007155 [Trichoderma semiorbis]